MRNLFVMFVTVVCFLFRLKLKWPKNKNVYDVTSHVFGSVIFNSKSRLGIKEQKKNWNFDLKASTVPLNVV